MAVAAASLINVTSHGGAPFKVPFLLSLHHMAQMVAQQFSLSLSFLSSYILYSLSYPAAIKAQLGIFNSETRSAVQCSSTVECSAMMSLLNCYTNDNDDDDDDEDDDDG